MVQKKFLLIILLITIISTLFVSIPVSATVEPTNFNHVIPFTITDTSGVARTNVPVIITYDVNGKLVATGLTNATFTNTYADTSGAGNNPIGSGTTVCYMGTSSSIVAVVPSLSAYGNATINIYTGYSPDATSFDIISGNSGNITIADNTSLEPVNNCRFDFVVPVTSDSYSVVSKGSSFNIQNNGTGNLTVSFNGANSLQFISTSSQYCTKAAGVSNNITGSQLSVEFWFKYTTSGTVRSMFGFGDATAGAYFLRLDASNKIAFFANNAPATGYSSRWTSTNNVSINTWHYLTISYNSANATRTSVFMDGAELPGSDIGTGGNVFVPTTFLTIGDSYSGGYTEYFDGYIGRFRLSNIYRPLSTNQNAYNGSSPSSVDINTVSLYTFTEGSGVTLTDSTGTNNLTIVNSPSWSFDASLGSSSSISLASTIGTEATCSFIQDGVHAWFIVNGVSSANYTAVSILENSNDWFLYAPYYGYYKETVSGVQVLSYELSSLVSGTSYSTGNITTTHNAANVTGFGTTWTASMVGSSFKTSDGNMYKVLSVTDTTHLTLATNYLGVSLTSSSTSGNTSYKMYGTIPNLGTFGAYGNGGITFGANSNITITVGGIATTLSPTVVGQTNAQLQGNLADTGNYTTLYLSFEFGTTTSYGSQTTEIAVTTNQSFTVSMSGLMPSTTYHYRMLARNGIVFSYGADFTVTTAYSTSTGGSTSITIVSASIFQNYTQTGDWLITAEIINTYPPYYPTGTPSRYFEMRILGTDGTTILGSYPIQQWGDRPQSIYLNSSANMTYGANYTITVASIISGLTITPSYSANYSLQWSGNISNIDDWAIGCATQMQITDGTILTTPYLTTDSTYGTVITNNAAGYFTTGIPGIAQIRPFLFQQAQIPNNIPTLPSNIDYNSGSTLQGRVGTSIVNDANTLGAVFGITGQNLLFYIMLLIIAGCVLFVISKTNGFGALGALCLTVPIVGAGVYFNIMNIVLPVFAGIIFVFLFVRQFIWKTL